MTANVIPFRTRPAEDVATRWDTIIARATGTTPSTTPSGEAMPERQALKMMIQL